jgi:hypothetical protein
MGVKRPGREADHSHPSSAEVKKSWSYTSIPQYAFMVWCPVKAQGQLYVSYLQNYIYNFFIICISVCDFSLLLTLCDSQFFDEANQIWQNRKIYVPTLKPRRRFVSCSIMYLARHIASTVVYGLTVVLNISTK